MTFKTEFYHLIRGQIFNENLQLLQMSSITLSIPAKVNTCVAIKLFYYIAINIK